MPRPPARINDDGNRSKRTREGSPFRTESEVGDLFEHLQRERLSSWENGRLYSLMLLVCTTGIRGPKALRLRVENFDFAAGKVSIPAATGPRVKRRGRPIQGELMEFTREPLGEWSRRCGSEWMFPGKEKSSTWSHAAANKQLDEVSVKVGLPEGTTIEMVRHSVFHNAWSRRLSEASQQRDFQIYTEPSE